MQLVDFQEYKRKYPKMSFVEVQKWHSRLWKDYPKQTYYNLDAVKAAFDSFRGSLNVLEMGGWDGELACALTGCVGTAVVVTRCCQKRLCQECKEGVRRARCPFCRATPLESDRITVGQSTRLREMAGKDVLESATAAGKRSLTQPIPAPPPAKRTHPTAQQIPHLQPSPTSTSRVDEATSSQRFPPPTYSLDSPVRTDGDGEAIRSGSSGALTGGANGAESGADSAVPAEG